MYNFSEKNMEHLIILDAYLPITRNLINLMLFSHFNFHVAESEFTISTHATFSFVIKHK
jgi:hypothetical protein